MMALGSALVAFHLLVQEPANNPPDITDESAACAEPAARPQVCARVFDDRGVARVRVLFRAQGDRHYFAAEMRFDGARYCVHLPAPLKTTPAVDYYVEAVDSDFEPTRAAAKTVAVTPRCPASTAAPPEAPTPVTPVQPGEKLVGFEPATFTLPAPAASNRGN